MCHQVQTSPDFSSEHQTSKFNYLDFHLDVSNLSLSPLSLLLQLLQFSLEFINGMTMHPAAQVRKLGVIKTSLSSPTQMIKPC